MAAARTGAERYLRDRKADPEYERAYNAARQRIDRNIGTWDEETATAEAAAWARAAGRENGEDLDEGSLVPRVTAHGP